jgi:hypothetical protein
MGWEGAMLGGTLVPPILLSSSSAAEWVREHRGLAQFRLDLQ